MNISIIGAGAMGGAVAEGLLSAGHPASQLTVSNPSTPSLQRFVKAGAATTSDNTEAVRDADIIILAVKPWIVPDVIAEIEPYLDYTRQAIMVIAAGVNGESLRSLLEREGDESLLPVSLVMPNTAVALRESMTFIVPVNGDTAMAEELFGRLGAVLTIDEKMLPAATTLASCGIAYAMRYIRAAMEGGVQLGFKAELAQEIVVQTVRGACALLAQPGAHPESEIDKVTTPGGLTIKGLNEMEHAGFTSAVIRGLKAGAAS